MVARYTDRVGTHALITCRKLVAGKVGKTQPSDAGNALGTSVACDGVSDALSDDDRTPFLEALLIATFYLKDGALCVPSTALNGGWKGYSMLSGTNQSVRSNSVT